MTQTALTLAAALLSCTALAQTAPLADTLKDQQLHGITIRSYPLQMKEVKQLSSIHHTYILSGKKHEVIAVQDLPANLADKTGRQIFAKIPGAFVYDMDGSGNQVNLATRGLDPHRSWEYNVRQDGVLTNSDIYAYPASHYSAPMESVQQIELIRGTSSLQYGAQFGGMINYIVKEGDTSKVLSVEALNSIGSFGLLSTYNAVGGKKGRLSYYGYYHKRVSAGYRQNAQSTTEAQYVRLKYALRRATLQASLGRNQYLYRSPGPLTDSMFRHDARQSTRSRNYFSPDIYLPALTLHWYINTRTQLHWITSAVLGFRNSLQYIALATVPDTVEAVTRQYRPRQVDIDGFNSYTSELRMQHDYRMVRIHHTLTSGLRYINNHLHRRQLGQGTTGTDYDLSVTGSFGRDVHLKTQNVAWFAENLMRLHPRWDLSFGVRIEAGQSNMSGKIAYLSDEELPRKVKHHFPLFGLSTQVKVYRNQLLYAGWSQAYRPVIFADLIPANFLERTDPTMHDAFGYNAEIGWKGKLGQRLTFDLSAFQLLYRNRIGSLALTDEQGLSYIWKTNIGDSRTEGLEVYAEGSVTESRVHRISLFTSTSWLHGRYLNGHIRNGNRNESLAGRQLETTPRWICRTGLQAAYKHLAIIVQHSYVADSYSDALNTRTPSTDGTRGIVPAYQVWDCNLAYRLGLHCTFRFGVNNLTNAQYFTKRPTGYPGQGVWSSDGRSVVASLGLKW